MAGFLTELHVQGFGCLKDVKCKLTPLHAFIGPNDSGKSTMLRAISHVFDPHQIPFKGAVTFADRSSINLVPGAGGVTVSFPDKETAASLGGNAFAMRVTNRLEHAQTIRLSADELRDPGQLIAHGQPLVLQGRGGNIAGLYDAVRDRSVDRFSAISKRVSALFPSVQSLGLRALNQGQKVLVVTLVDGTEVLSGAMSEGLLYFLAFAILSELERPAVYLVEEPENGLHPSRIADIVHMLRAITEDAANPVQVIMATHSPLVVNELRPEEVTVVTRDPVKGTELRPIKGTPNFEERSKVYALGELWLSYANGKDEAPLFSDQGP